MSRELKNNQVPYEQVLRDAAEQIAVIALRLGVDNKLLVVAFDTDRRSGTLSFPRNFVFQEVGYNVN